jgi:vesicle-fusing ATPase
LIFFLGLVTVLVEGPPNSGKTAIAAQLAKNSDFPFVKICTPEDMVGFSESAKCLQIRKVINNNSFLFNAPIHI